jgi:hypothetical protein
MSTRPAESLAQAFEVRLLPAQRMDPCRARFECRKRALERRLPHLYCVARFSDSVLRYRSPSASALSSVFWSERRISRAAIPSNDSSVRTNVFPFRGSSL